MISHHPRLERLGSIACLNGLSDESLKICQVERRYSSPGQIIKEEARRQILMRHESFIPKVRFEIVIIRLMSPVADLYNTFAHIQSAD